MIKYKGFKNDHDKARKEVLEKMKDMIELREWCVRHNSLSCDLDDFNNFLEIIEKGGNDNV